MSLDEKKLQIVSEQGFSTPPAAAGDHDQTDILAKQTRTRRLFTGAQLFAFSLVYQGTWYSVAGNIYFVLQNGGTAAWLFSYLIVVAGVLCQAASFAELASIQPIAGAQYYWTYHFSPPRTRLFLTWVQGWTTWLGYVAVLASCLNMGALFIEGMVVMSHPDYVPGGWHTTVIILGYIAFITLTNMYAFPLVPWFELLNGILNVVLFLIVLVVLWVMAPRNSLDVFLVKSAASGWDNYFVSFNIGTLSNLFLFVSFEGLIHMGEETRNPSRAIPQALFWGMVTNCCLGFVMIITFGICMPSTDALLESASPIVTIMEYATGSRGAATAVVSGLVVLGVAGNTGVLASVSRLSWAWARDGGLPGYFAHVDARTRVPLRAVLGTAILVVLLSLLNLSEEAYVALGAVTSLSSLALYVSYAIVLACVLHARLLAPGGVKLGDWNMGSAGPFVNAAALLYTLYEMVWLPFPNLLPVTATTMNYCGPVYGAVVLGAVGWWFLWARKHWKGPNRAIVEIVLRRDESSG